MASQEHVVTIQGLDTSDPALIERVRCEMQDRVQTVLGAGTAEVSLMDRGHWHAKLKVHLKDALPPSTHLPLGSYASAALAKNTNDAGHSRHFITVREVYPVTPAPSR